VKTTGS